MATDEEPRAAAVTMKALRKKPLTARRATSLIVSVTFLVTVAGGVAIWLLDHKEFPNLGTSLWWSVQTITTVGYGDVVPQQTTGRVIGALIMLNGIGFIAVMTAAVTASLIEAARRRQRESSERDTLLQLDRIEARLGAIEDALGQGGHAAGSSTGEQEQPSREPGAG
jgi:voltage-gated potassium channel